MASVWLQVIEVKCRKVLVKSLVYIICPIKIRLPSNSKSLPVYEIITVLEYFQCKQNTQPLEIHWCLFPPNTNACMHQHHHSLFRWKSRKFSLSCLATPTLTHYNQGGAKSTTPNLERRNGMGGLSALAFCQHDKIPERNNSRKLAPIKQTITWHGGDIWQKRLLTLWKPGSRERKWPWIRYTLQKRYVLGHLLLLTWSHFLTAYQLGCKYVSVEESLPSTQEAVYLIPSNTHTPLQLNQTTKVSADDVQKQANTTFQLCLSPSMG